jgi:hypothetical protein
MGGTGEGDEGQLRLLHADLEKIAAAVRTVAYQNREQSLQLLAVLRSLEALHQEIRDGLFQESLPDNRQALYNLLKDIESTGGWPYIHRMRLQEFISRLLTVQADDNDEASQDHL